MCYAVRCPVCAKTGWEGCGQHVDEVLQGVPPSQRCTCPDQTARTAAGPAPQP
jgi:hypothetical protein